MSIVVYNKYGRPYGYRKSKGKSRVSTVIDTASSLPPEFQSLLVDLHRDEHEQEILNAIAAQEAKDREAAEALRLTLPKRAPKPRPETAWDRFINHRRRIRLEREEATRKCELDRIQAETLERTKAAKAKRASAFESLRTNHSQPPNYNASCHPNSPAVPLSASSTVPLSNGGKKTTKL